MDMTVTVQLQSLDVTDRMKHGNEFRYLVTSDRDLISQGVHDDTESKNLVDVEYIRCDGESPEYVSKYKGIDHTVQVTLSTLNFVVTRSSVLKLHNFVLHTFVDAEANPTEAVVLVQQENKDPVPQASEPQNNNNNVYVRLLLDSVNFILNNDGVRLATGELSLGDLSAIVTNGQVNVAAKFANLTLTDNLTPVKSSGGHHAFANQLLTIQGEELIDLRYNSYINDGRKDYPGYDHALYLRMGSARFNFLEQPIHQFMEFLSKFAEMKSTYDMARQAALQSAQQFSEAATKMHFDVVIETPVVLFPEFHENDDDVVVAHLGEIWASNKFVDTEDGSFNVIKAGLRAINLTSKFYFSGLNQNPILQTLPMVDDIDFNLDINITQNPSTTHPDIDIRGHVEDVNVRLTERQYVFLMEAINMFPRIFSAPNESDQTETGSLATVAKPVEKEQKQTPAITGPGSDKLPRIRFYLDTKTIGLEIYKVTGETVNVQTPPSLARIALNNSSVLVKMQKDDTIAVSLVVTSLTVDDTRPGINSKFKEIVPVIEGEHQFELQLDLKEPNPARSGIVMMNIRDPKVILSLDHAFLLRDFFTLPFNGKTQQQQQQQQQQKQGPNSERREPEQGLDLSFVLKISNAEFILLANPDREDSEAVVLSTEELMITQQVKTALVAKQMGMFLCRMDMRNKSTLRFIQPFDVNFSMNSNPRNENGGLLTDLIINIDPLVLRLSYRDAMLVTDIFNKAFELYNASQKPDAAPQKPVVEQNQIELFNSLEFAQESVILVYR
jgi:vacuolar protein sorting-associated protein 13A/C